MMIRWWGTCIAAVLAAAVALRQSGTGRYSYVRAVAIDHTRVPNTDQMNFPLLVSVIDGLLEILGNGGHMVRKVIKVLSAQREPGVVVDLYLRGRDCYLPSRTGRTC